MIKMTSINDLMNQKQQFKNEFVQDLERSTQFLSLVESILLDIKYSYIPNTLIYNGTEATFDPCLTQYISKCILTNITYQPLLIKSLIARLTSELSGTGKYLIVQVLGTNNLKISWNNNG